MTGYLDAVRIYSNDTIKPLIESFKMTSASLTEGSLFDVDTMSVTTEFQNRGK